MIALRCTSKVMKRFKLEAEDELPASDGRLGDWYVNLLNIRSHRLAFQTAVILAEAPFNPIDFKSPIAKTHELLGAEGSRQEGGR